MWSSLLMDNSNHVTAEILVLTPAVVRLAALALGIAATALALLLFLRPEQNGIKRRAWDTTPAGAWNWRRSWADRISCWNGQTWRVRKRCRWEMAGLESLSGGSKDSRLNSIGRTLFPIGFHRGRLSFRG
jgi:hypothetical protein